MQNLKNMENMKNELGKNLTAFKRLFKFPQIKLGWGLFAIGLFTLAVIVGIWLHPVAGLATLAIAPAIKFKKEGLEKDSDGYKCLEMLEKRLTIEGPDGLTKAEIDTIIDAKVKAWEGLDIGQVKALLDADKGVMKILAAQGEQITSMKGQLANQPVDESIRAQVVSWHTKIKMF